MIGVGLTYMLVGMGTVFVFLTVLVAASTLMSRVVMHYRAGLTAVGVGPEEIAAITAAIAQHRRNQR